MRPSVIAGIIAIPTALAVAPAAQAGSPACAARSNNTEKKLRSASRSRAREPTKRRCRRSPTPMAALARLELRDTTRAGNMSREQLEAAGYEVELDPFPFTFFAPAELQQLTPVARCTKRACSPVPGPAT